MERLQGLLITWQQQRQQPTAMGADAGGAPGDHTTQTPAGGRGEHAADLCAGAERGLPPEGPPRRALLQQAQAQAQARRQPQLQPQPQLRGGRGLALPGSLLSSLADLYGLGGGGPGQMVTSGSATPVTPEATAAGAAAATAAIGGLPDPAASGNIADVGLLVPGTVASGGSGGGGSSRGGAVFMFGDGAPRPTPPSPPASSSSDGTSSALARPAAWQPHRPLPGSRSPAAGTSAVHLRVPSYLGPTGLPSIRATTTTTTTTSRTTTHVTLPPSITLGGTRSSSTTPTGGTGGGAASSSQPPTAAISVPAHVLHDDQLYDADYVVPGLEDDPYGHNPLFDPLYRAGMDALQCAEAAGAAAGGPAGATGGYVPSSAGAGTLASEGLPGLCLAPHAPLVAQLAQPLYEDDYTQDFGSAVHGTPEAVYGPAGLQLDALRVATLQAAQFEPGTWSVAGGASTGSASGGGGRGGSAWRSSSGRGSGTSGGVRGSGLGYQSSGGSGGNSSTAGGGMNPYEAALGPYVPYTDRVLFSPIARLIGVPYPASIYAGELYIAEADPLLTAAGQAARAGLLVDYYLERRVNYYTPFTFTRAGPSVVALTASTARSRGQIGVAAKARALAQALYSYQRSRYLANSVEVAVGGRGFAGASLGAYLFNNPLVNNQFLLQGPDLAP
ncbi:hypothetical protein HYH02_000063 [Chlamydomonas schloesseri]|uniref:Uncharacterized protein n=1 Tax=Chlamydomonas schloesseri TaxID=2026947 RepID=A0A835WMI7_9CHLO|nr:hypothetical protein HYH02_000063 [Chlamydomonas schloesseri]|eukprot:KAG2449959.1 hypothetical protein HYH02_000063 [Chlamydomonas schloesseri]